MSSQPSPSRHPFQYLSIRLPVVTNPPHLLSFGYQETLAIHPFGYTYFPIPSSHYNTSRRTPTPYCGSPSIPAITFLTLLHHFFFCHQPTSPSTFSGLSRNPHYSSIRIYIPRVSFIWALCGPPVLLTDYYVTPWFLHMVTRQLSVFYIGTTQLSFFSYGYYATLGLSYGYYATPVLPYMVLCSPPFSYMGTMQPFCLLYGYYATLRLLFGVLCNPWSFYMGTM
jgi:hypothetical protein